MTTTIRTSNFELHEIEKMYWCNFEACGCRDLTDFFAQGLKWIGDALRPNGSQYFWSDGFYCWFTDANQDHEQGVFITKSGNIMFKDFGNGKLYRVEFK